MVDQDEPDNRINHGARFNIVAALGGGVALTSISGYRHAAADVFTGMERRINAQKIATLPAYLPGASSPQTFKAASLGIEIRQRYKSQETQGVEWRARQDSNLRPQA